MHCPHCLHELPDAAAPICPHCSAVLAVAVPANSIPFEDRSRPFFERLLATIGLAFSDPARLFSSVPAEGIGAPVLFYLVLQVPALVVGLLWQLAFTSLFSLAQHDLSGMFLGPAFIVGLMVCSPLLLLVWLFVVAGIFHLMLLLFGDGQRGFGVTLRAQAYGSTPSLLAIVPVCGGAIGGLWTLVLVILGATWGHKTDGWRATLAYLAPIVLCGCLVTVLIVLGIAGLAEALR
jgi:hypothetical protein